MNTQPATRTAELKALALLFLKLGTIGFGGPAAHLALMEQEVVQRRKWLTHEEFLDLMGATNLIPGPNSTEMAIHIGYRRAGFAGLVVAGVCFIVPATLIVMACGWVYRRYGELPSVEAILYGIKPVIIAIVGQALWNLGRSALKTRLLAIIAVAAATLNFSGANELALLFGAGVIALLARAGRSADAPAVATPPPMLKALVAAAAPASTTSAAGAAFGLWPLFWFFVKVGSVLYGSGYVLLAFLRSGIVERFGWLTEEQLLDAVAVGQFTPGPVFTTATFIGYVLGGTPAALVATAGIFLPAFVFVAASGPLVPWLRKSALAGAFLDGVVAASLALMAVVTFHLVRSALIDWVTLLVGATALWLLLRHRTNSLWLVPGGAVVGLARLFFL
ncbi:MAG TPA: chromate efflux transporter [Verrucomicrobiota bacterium]|nr:chromate efflux transporter [Verrucomicrobiota bacterium]HPU57696.1 chromate efflux transporter [Verrucomicrobiota bacterium]